MENPKQHETKNISVQINQFPNEILCVQKNMSIDISLKTSSITSACYLQRKKQNDKNIELLSSAEAPSVEGRRRKTRKIKNRGNVQKSGRAYLLSSFPVSLARFGEAVTLESLTDNLWGSDSFIIIFLLSMLSPAHTKITIREKNWVDDGLGGWNFESRIM